MFKRVSQILVGNAYQILPVMQAIKCNIRLQVFKIFLLFRREVLTPFQSELNFPLFKEVGFLTISAYFSPKAKHSLDLG